MADSILKIRTQDGDKPIGYPGLADKPVANKTLDTEGAFADAKAVGDKFKEVKEDIIPKYKKAQYVKTNTNITYNYLPLKINTGVDVPNGTFVKTNIKASTFF